MGIPGTPGMPGLNGLTGRKVNIQVCKYFSFSPPQTYILISSYFSFYLCFSSCENFRVTKEKVGSMVQMAIQE